MWFGHFWREVGVVIELRRCMASSVRWDYGLNSADVCRIRLGGKWMILWVRRGGLQTRPYGQGGCSKKMVSNLRSCCGVGGCG